MAIENNRSRKQLAFINIIIQNNSVGSLPLAGILHFTMGTTNTIHRSVLVLTVSCIIWTLKLTTVNIRVSSDVYHVGSHREVEHVRKPNSVLRGYVNSTIEDDPNDVFECVNYSQVRGARGVHVIYPICIYEPEVDTVISRKVKDGSGWEVKYVNMILQQLGEPRSDMGLIDIGANIGVYSLAAAAVGHQVVALEPNFRNVRRLNKAIEKGGVGENIVVVHAGISNETSSKYMLVGRRNMGWASLVPRTLCVPDAEFTCDVQHPVPVVYMDDLLEVITFTNAVIKIDIEGLEARAFQRSQRLLAKLNVSYILMEFVSFTYNKWWSIPHKKREVDEFITYMKERGYTPKIDLMTSLDRTPWKQWPQNIIWTK